MKKYRLVVETFQVAGRFQHKVYEQGFAKDRSDEISNDVVDVLKKANEALWEEIPKGSGPLKTTFKY